MHATPSAQAKTPGHARRRNFPPDPLKNLRLRRDCIELGSIEFATFQNRRLASFPNQIKHMQENTQQNQQLADMEIGAHTPMMQQRVSPRENAKLAKTYA
jgi:hypothetical protein